MAALIKPKSDKELEKIIKVKPKQGEVFTQAELYSFVGYDFKIIPLMSDDLLLVQTKPVGGKNELASILTHQDVLGTVLLVEPKEID